MRLTVHTFTTFDGVMQVLGPPTKIPAMGSTTAPARATCGRMDGAPLLVAAARCVAEDHPFGGWSAARPRHRSTDRQHLGNRRVLRRGGTPASWSKRAGEQVDYVIRP